jgi:hypothetical protein
MIRNNLFIFRIFAPQDRFVLFFHSGLKIINLVQTGYATTVHQQVFNEHWVILQQFYGFVWVCAVLFKTISFGKVVNFC